MARNAIYMLQQDVICRAEDGQSLETSARRIDLLLRKRARKIFLAGLPCFFLDEISCNTSQPQFFPCFKPAICEWKLRFQHLLIESSLSLQVEYFVTMTWRIKRRTYCLWIYAVIQVLYLGTQRADRVGAPQVTGMPFVWTVVKNRW